MKTYNLHIAGVKPTRDFYILKSPYDNKPVAKIEKADKASILKAINNADVNFQKIMKQMPAWQRAEILYKVSDILNTNQEELAQTIAKESGKPIKHARIEATRAVNTVKMSADEALQLNGEQITMDRARGSETQLAFTIKQPLGPVLAVSAFNWPLNLTCHLVATAIAAGNTIVLKPATQTPVASLMLAKYFEQAGLPQGCLNVITASGSDMDIAVTDSRFKYVSFIGSAVVGWGIKSKVAPGVKVALEHGGTGTAIIESDADIDHVIKTVLIGGYIYAGQVCVSTQNLYVHAKIYDQIIKKLKAGIAKLKTGNPLKDATDVGPMISAKEVERVGNWVQESINNGAKLIIGGKKISKTVYAPTLLAGVQKSDTIFKEEVFGPVLSIRKYTNLDNVIAEMNKSKYAFQTAIYTQDIDKGLKFATQIESKAAMVNNMTAFRVDWMPFGGSKMSGFGVGGMKYAIADMMEEKLVVINRKS